MRLRSLVWFVAAIALPCPGFATLVLLSDSRTASASSNNSAGASQSVTNSATPFQSGTIGASATGSSSSMTASFGNGSIDLHSGAAGFLDASAVSPDSSGLRWAQTAASVSFTFSFSVDTPTWVRLQGYRDNESLSGPISLSLTSDVLGNVPLNFFSYPYYNYLDQSILLNPNSVYTLSGGLNFGLSVFGSSYDGGSQRLDVNLAVVPDSGRVITLVAVGLAVVGVLGTAWGRKRRRDR
jgi:hypothetical protein